MIFRTAILILLISISIGFGGSSAADSSGVPQASDIAGEMPAPSDGEGGSEPTEEAPTESFFNEDELDPLFDDDFELDQAQSRNDPLEETNRAVFALNQGIDRFLLGPIASFFGYVTPGPLKLGLRNFFDNLNSPVVIINDVLQLEWKDAAVSLGAFVVNSTCGIVGLFEPAQHIGMPRHFSDFGQTLAIAQLPSGPYLVIPIAGPSTARGTVGSMVDLMMRPNTWILPVTALFSSGGEGVVRLEEHQDELEELERSSVDFYSVLRSAYLQTREEQIWGRREHRRMDARD
jgi:phospholipid-binding lipoprotein MlaA